MYLFRLANVPPVWNFSSSTWVLKLGGVKGSQRGSEYGSDMLLKTI